MLTFTLDDLTEDQKAYLKTIEGCKFALLEPCPECGAPMGEHIIGGPGPYHPKRD